MRKILFSILMASAIAAPAAAQRQHSWADDNQARSEAREARQQAREERQQAREESRQSRQEQVQARQEAQQQARSEAIAARSQTNDQNVSFRGNANQGGARAHAEGRATRADLEAIRAARLAQSQSQSQSVDTTHQWSSPEAQQRNRALRQHRGDGTLRQSDREVPRTFRNSVPVVSDTPREGTQPPLRVRSRDHTAQSWSTRWRHDGRYDWQNYRNRHRSLFRLGYYYDPFGWNYQPYDIGWRLWPSYYSSRFWISDPWEYRLPYAPPGYRWIRYFDDAILVDTWTGEVADVIYNFFW